MALYEPSLNGNADYSSVPALIGPDGKPLPRFLLPHVQTFSSLFNLPSKSYLANFDEALKNSRKTARDMVRDASIQRWVHARRRPVAKAEWSITTEDPKDEAQQEFAKQMTAVVKATPHFMKFRDSLLKAVWYGRYGVQVVNKKQAVNGKKAWVCNQWAPVNGDKITFRWNGSPGIRIYRGVSEDLEAEGAVIEPNDQGITLFLDKKDWRERFVIHKHEIDDADFEEPDLAGGVHGVGLRHYLYWVQWLKLEVFAWLLNYLENMGAGGLTVVYYEAGNAASKAAAEAAFESPANVVFVPRPVGAEKQGSGVERLEPSGTGNQILMNLVDNYFNGVMKEFILGQDLSSSAKPTGLGSGVAALHAETLQDILDFDAANLDETLSREWLTPLARLNKPDLNFEVYFRTTLREPDPEPKLRVGKMLYDMGIDLKKDELREIGGFSKPQEDDETVVGGEQGQQPEQQSFPHENNPQASNAALARLQQGEADLPEMRVAMEQAGIPAEQQLHQLANLVESGQVNEADGPNGAVYSIKGGGKKPEGEPDQPDDQPIQFGKEDWTQETGPRGGKRWIHAGTGRIEYGDENPDHATSDFKVAPEAFQYKLGTDKETGAGGELKSVNYDPKLAGVLHHWEDTEGELGTKGQKYIVNGHHRFELAQRSGAHRVLSMPLHEAKTAKEARAAGALVNMAEGHGTAVDAAKFMRDTDITAEDLKARNVSLKGKIADQATALAALEPSLFNKVVQGEMGEAQAIALGKNAPTHAAQMAAVKDAEKYAKKHRGREPSGDIMAELATQAEMAPKVTEEKSDLFGGFSEEKSTHLERAELTAFFKGKTAELRNAFKSIGTERKAGMVGEAGNVLNIEENKKRADQHEAALESFGRMAYLKGPVSDILNEHAVQLAENPKNADSIKRSLVSRLNELFSSPERYQEAIKAADAGTVHSGGEGASPVSGEPLPSSEPGAPEGTGAQGQEKRIGLVPEAAKQGVAPHVVDRAEKYLQSLGEPPAPPVEGMTRLYRGHPAGQPVHENSFFSDERGLAGVAIPFAQQNGRSLHYVDVPKDVAEKGLLKSGVTDGEYQLPEEYRGQVKQWGKGQASGVEPRKPEISQAFLGMTDAEQRRHIESGKATSDEKLLGTNRTEVSADDLARRDWLRANVTGRPEVSTSDYNSQFDADLAKQNAGSGVAASGRLPKQTAKEGQWNPTNISQLAGDTVVTPDGNVLNISKGDDGRWKIGNKHGFNDWDASQHLNELGATSTPKLFRPEQMPHASLEGGSAAPGITVPEAKRSGKPAPVLDFSQREPSQGMLPGMEDAGRRQKAAGTLRGLFDSIGQNQPEEPEEAAPETPTEPDEPNFTGTTTDALGREYHWVNGKRVAGPEELAAATEHETPRETAAREHAKSDYAFARESSVPNFGEDLLGSARHKRNAWRGLEDAEKEGHAEELVTREHLLKNEPHNLLANVKPHNAYVALAGHHALGAFPANPFAYSTHEDYVKSMGRNEVDRNGNPLKPKSKEELRKQYYDTYKGFKDEIEKAANEEFDPRALAVRLKTFLNNRVRELRGQTSNTSLGEATADDRYNPVANALIRTINTLNGRGPSSIHGRTMAFTKELSNAYGKEPTPEHLEKAVGHVQDIMEGHSLNKTFGKVGAKAKGFSPADIYVKHAERVGGPKVDASTVKASTEYLKNNFGLRGVQHGNSVTDEERAHHQQKAAEAFADLADILGLPEEAISMGGKLGIAFGARGTAGTLAHYEPGSKVINLTRTGGVGSLAHEWGHFFDHQLMAGLRGKDVAGFRSKLNYIPPGDEAAKDMGDAFEKLNGEMWKFKDRMDDDFSKNKRELLISDKKYKDYYRSPEEMFARAFETHVQHKLEEKGRKNTYLAGANKDSDYIGYKTLWPNDAERKALAPGFDAIVAAFNKHKDRFMKPFPEAEKPEEKKSYSTDDDALTYCAGELDSDETEAIEQVWQRIAARTE